MVAQVNAAIRGAKAAGATEVIWGRKATRSEDGARSIRPSRCLKAGEEA